MRIIRVATLGILSLVTAGLVFGVGGQEEQGLALAVGQVYHVVDGDTFWITLLSDQDHQVPQDFIRVIDGVARVKIRPYLMSTFETPHECFGPEAEEYLWHLLFHRMVWLIHQGEPAPDQDNGGTPRLMALVYLEPISSPLRLEDLDPERGALLQALLVAQGFAKVDIRPRPEPFLQIERPFEARMNRAEEFAKAHHLGLWRDCAREDP